MDSWVEKKLLEWDLVSLQQIFKDEEVDEDAFRNLNEEVIQNLIRKTGPRVKFLTRWKREFGTVIEHVTEEHFNNHQPQNESDLSPSVSKQEIFSDDRATSTPRPEEFDFSRIDNADLNFELTNPVTDVIATLRSSALGICILHYYKSHRTLTDEHRTVLVEILIDVEIRTTPDLVITPVRLIKLADLIVDAFPTEIVETYYIPYKYDKANKLKILPKGKLFSKYNNLFRARLLTSGVVKKTGSKRKVTEITGSVHLGFTSDLQADISEEEFAEKLSWLKSNIDPWCEVQKLWSDTSKKRIYNLITDTCITNYIESFVILKHLTNGPVLIDIDFSTIYPNKKLNLFNNFDTFEKQVVSYCTKKKRKSAALQLLLQQISSLDQSKDLNSAEQKKICVLKLLPLVLPLPGPFQSVQSIIPPWKPSKEEVQQGFILHVEDDAKLKAELKKRRENLKKFGLTEQPIVAVVGTYKVESCTVHINNISYQLPSVLQAVDTAFKSFYAFQLLYPKESEYPWMVIQRKIYDVKGEKDGVVLPSILTFIADLNNCKV